MTDASPTNPAPPTLTAAERLLAIEGIKRTFAGRLRCMDTKDWASYASFHTDDVVSDSWQSDGAAQPETGSDAAGTDTGSDDRPAPVTGGTALTAAIRATLDGDVPVVSVHHGHTPEIELTSDTTARGVWAMEDRLWWTRGDGTTEWLHGYGHYHEEYRKVGDRWLISYRALTRLRVDASPGFYER